MIWTDEMVTGLRRSGHIRHFKEIESLGLGRCLNIRGYGEGGVQVVVKSTDSRARLPEVEY